MEILETLRALNACFGPSGQEGAVAEAIRKIAAPYVDECTVDTLGNLLCHKKGKGPKVLFAAHMDSIGLIITHIDEHGFLRFGPVGGLSAHEVLGAPVRFANGVKGVVALEGKVEAKEMKLEHLYVDIGARDEKEAKAMVQVGDVAVYDTAAFQSGSRIFSPYLDDRIACVVLLMAMERLGETDTGLTFAFTVQEEGGLRGAPGCAPRAKKNSNPPSPQGGLRRRRCPPCSSPKFQPTPSARRVTCLRPVQRRPIYDFNPHPPQGG